MGVLGQSHKRDPGAKPLVIMSGWLKPLKLKAFLFFININNAQICSFFVIL